MTLAEGIGLVAAACSTIGFLPQAIKVLRHRQTRDISLWSYLLFVTATVLWLIYGLSIQSTPVIVANVITLPITFATLIMKLRLG